MELLNVSSVPAIATIVYWTINLIKYAVDGKESFKRLIPILSAALGGAIGIIAYYAIPGVVPADNVLIALIVGGASGLSATGTNQIFKQLSKEDKSE